jgi:hypothetical protein
VESVVVLSCHGCASGDELAILDRELVSVPENAKVRVSLKFPDGRGSLEAVASYEIGHSSPQQRVPILAFADLRAGDIPEGSTAYILEAIG